MFNDLDPSRKALETFADLPPTIQAGIRDEGRVIGTAVGNHSVKVLFGPPGASADPTKIKHGTGVVVFTGGGLILVTAAHVVLDYFTAAKNAPLTFQVGNVKIDPKDRLISHDVQRDIATLRVLPAELTSIPAMVWMAPRWPPPVPSIGDYVAFAGYAKEFRKDLGPGHLELNPAGGLMPITSVSPTSIKCVLPRDTLIAVHGDEVPPAGTEYGGMSGGPVFRVRPGPLELIGVVTDFGDFFDMFWFGPLISINAAGRLTDR